MSAGQITQGRKRSIVDPDTQLPTDSVNGDYWKQHGIWYGWCPADGKRLLCNLANHTITEHDDGSITVAPSILCGFQNPTDDGQRKIGSWHGYLEHGVWREV